MSALDIALTVILSYFLIRGIFRGLVKEVVGILGLFVAFWAASVYWKAGADQLRPIIESENWRGVLSFVIIYMIIYFLVGLMSIFIDKIVKMTITPLCSGLVGAGLGVLKGTTLCLIILTATTAFLQPNSPFYAESIAWKSAEPWCEQVKSWIPENLQRLMRQKSQTIVQDLRSTPPPQAPLQAGPTAQPLQTPAGQISPPADYQQLLALARSYPQLISQAWLEKIYTLSPESVDADLLRRFVQENRTLFSAQQTTPPANQTAPVEAPTWPSQATE
ncbi:MAG: CvpA family protein [Deltaproteobacteria bacterium]|nr:CvpA family protein [Deltaproteobacteria bacterium]